MNHYIKENHKDELHKGLVDFFKVIPKKTVVSIMYGNLLKIISSYEHIKDNLTVVNFCSTLGEDLIRNYYYYKYLNVKSIREKDKKYSLSNWKSENRNLLDIFEDNTVVFSIGSVLLGWMIHCKLLDKNIITISKKERVNIVILTKILSDTITNRRVYNIPKKLPMIVPPKLYTKEQLGGYLLNDELITNSLVRKKWSNKHISEITEENIIYTVVNKISSIGYKINKDVLEFILSHNDYLKGEMIDPNYTHPLLEKSKLTKVEKLELDSFLSKKELQENILGLALVYSNVPSFYIPVQLDFRGRLNCIAEYLNYQSNSLAKSLLLFSKGEKIKKNDMQALDYLKLYGANCFGLDKKSVVERLAWIDSNIDKIINFENGILIKQAKEKFLFIAFCIEFNRWIKCLNDPEVYEFDTFLPIQLDATCNGFQHLSLLSLDPTLGLELNLTQSNKEDVPNDLYSFLITNLMDHLRNEMDHLSNDLNNKEITQTKIEEIKEKLEAYKRIIDSKIKRYIIKKAIMTIPYNVSYFQLLNYIKENFVRIDSTEFFTTKEDNNIKLHYSDFNLIGKGLNEVLNYKFPKLNLLLKYLEKIAKICTILQMPIVWSLPSGLIVKQGYLEEEEVRIKPFFYDKSKFVLKVTNSKVYNKNKQIRAFMPNLVHSLDAASLALLLDSYFNDGLQNIFTVHDCFAVTVNNVSNLLEFLKLTYIKIYSEETYLKKLDREILENIKSIYGNNIYDESTRIIKINNIELEFPNIDTVFGHEPKIDFDSLKKSSYILN